MAKREGRERKWGRAEKGEGEVEERKDLKRRGREENEEEGRKRGEGKSEVRTWTRKGEGKGERGGSEGKAEPVRRGEERRGGEAGDDH